ncbi:MAG: lipopolysaccharide biosynthesis protein [Pegethrix bostrychoides GSE-TBD4-15B]|jgi:O-antigen/teichoic acid export membrane protein|uniref:Lipopolysaccharide biosynthesis protein n=1 Tax=Pegethrix bostrychoides GSE-TBD4-15B TaxID=2839662 RepID=A0A951PE81_9CYAN|nr:lipopolysaccharide biosynthesis protein [Pegethrix bostrychoides GSE-TBD4-15B]
MLEDTPIEPSDSASLQPPVAQRSLKHRALSGSVWTLISHGGSQVLRLGGNLILTRLLFPEAFGLMALVQTFLTGLEMFSDVGINPSIVQSKRGDDPAFLNTAWTIQAGRGLMLWLCSCAIAYPAAQFYNEPMLAQLLPVSGLSALIAGFNSTKLATAHRHLKLRELTILEFSTYVIGLIIMIIGSFLFKSVWALVVGALVSGLARLVAGHYFLKGPRNRFYWDQEAYRALQRFGQWIFVSTVLGFFAAQGDRLVLGRLMSVEFLGIYTVALGFSGVAVQVIDQISNRVLFPSYSELVRDRPEQLYKTLRKARIVLIGTSAACTTFFVLFGEFIIDLLYDDRYVQAGKILQILAIGSMARSLSTTYGDVLMAKGKSYLLPILLVLGVTIQFSSMYFGARLGNSNGIIIGIAASYWIMYLFDVVCYSMLRLWQPEVDLPVAGLAVGLSAIVYFS